MNTIAKSLMVFFLMATMIISTKAQSKSSSSFKFYSSQIKKGGQSSKKANASIERQVFQTNSRRTGNVTSMASKKRNRNPTSGKKIEIQSKNIAKMKLSKDLGDGLVPPFPKKPPKRR